MEKLKKEELLLVVGGIKFSASLFSSILKGFDLLLELGRNVGTAIKRYKTKTLC